VTDAKSSDEGPLTRAGSDGHFVSGALLAGILEISVDAVIVIDHDHRIVLFNSGAETIFGYRAAEILNQPIDLLIPEDYRIEHSGHIRDFGSGDVMARRMDVRTRVFGRRKDGSVFPAEASITKVRINDAWVYSAVLRDITERIESEAALESHAMALARSNHELELFASIASHDLQEPLRKIRTFGERLLAEAGEELPGRSMEYIERMQAAAVRMSALISDLLAYARVTSRPETSLATDLTMLVREEAEALEVRLQETGGSIRVDELPTIVADRGQMRQLFQNLLGNALKFHRKGIPPEVVVTGCLLPVKGGMVELRVQDNGIGFEEKYADRIFDVFGRLHSRDAYEGTGMGLAICRKIAERHGGRVFPQSVPGVGTTMIVQLPVLSGGMAEK